MPIQCMFDRYLIFISIFGGGYSSSFFCLVYILCRVNIVAVATVLCQQ